MPRLSCWFIKALLLNLAAGATFGVLLLVAKAFPLSMSWVWLLLPAHIQFMMVGWMIQLALGMAYWILPRLNDGVERGRLTAVWSSLAALNLGATGAAILIAVRPFNPTPWLAPLLC